MSHWSMSVSTIVQQSNCLIVKEGIPIDLLRHWTPPTVDLLRLQGLLALGVEQETNQGAPISFFLFELHRAPLVRYMVVIRLLSKKKSYKTTVLFKMHFPLSLNF